MNKRSVVLSGVYAPVGERFGERFTGGSALVARQYPYGLGAQGEFVQVGSVRTRKRSGSKSRQVHNAVGQPTAARAPHHENVYYVNRRRQKVEVVRGLPPHGYTTYYEDGGEEQRLLCSLKMYGQKMRSWPVTAPTEIGRNGPITDFLMPMVAIPPPPLRNFIGVNTSSNGESTEGGQYFQHTDSPVPNLGRRTRRMIHPSVPHL